jgi:hypothetical protein
MARALTPDPDVSMLIKVSAHDEWFRSSRDELSLVPIRWEVVARDPHEQAFHAVHLASSRVSPLRTECV